MKKTLMSFVVIIVGAAAVAAAILVIFKHDSISRRLEQATLPEPQDYTIVATKPTDTPTTQPSKTSVPQPTKSTSLPSEINLDVPFTSQAPHASWELPYKEFCEEASVLMAMRYLTNQPINGPDDADQAMLAIKTFEEETFGYYQDTTAEETATIIRDHFDYDEVALVEDPTPNDIKQALATGKLVIMPAAGQLLPNPYFRAPGPPYHMIVIKGYTQEGKFITNDPGTRRGADFLYTTETIMNAMHDWRDDGNVEQGRKVILVVG